MRKRVSGWASIFLGLAFLGLLATSGLAQGDGSGRASPPAKAECRFADGKTIQVAYSSPRMRGRKIFGGLVPYGEVWRAGANEATSFVTNANLLVGGEDVPAGSYTLFTVPAVNRWTLIISRKTGEWGIPYPGESYDLLRTGMKVSKLPASRENFTIAFDRSGSSCVMRMEWETTRATVEISEKQ